jgi:hypothetical protein
MLALLAAPSAAQAQVQAQVKESLCIPCHEKVTPGIVKDFRSGLMGHKLDCTACHGTIHRSASDAASAKLPTAETCRSCHKDRYERFAAGKHALAWTAMTALPMTGFQPHAYIGGLKGCGGCHKIGLRPADSRSKEDRYGTPCDSCHTRHRFSREEAANPRACRTCHMGFDHPQWEMWSSAKHGVIYQIEGPGRAPACQTCHMPGGDHGVMTAWGFLGLRLPEADKEWLGWRTTVLKGMGVLSPEGQPTARLELVKKYGVARLSAAAWQFERDRMLAVCTKCHSERLARTNLENGDAMIKEADRLTAQGIDVVAGLYKDGLLKGGSGYPDVLSFYESTSPIEQSLYVMFLEHRNRTFQGAFHMNPDYVTWYGLAELRRDLVDIKGEAERMRGKR